MHKLTSKKLPWQYSGLHVSNIWLLKTDRYVSSLHGPSDTCLILQVQHNLRMGGGGWLQVSLFMKVSGRGKWRCASLLTRQSLKWKIFKVNSRESVFVSHQKMLQRGTIVAKESPIKNNEVHASPSKTTLSLLKQHCTVLECYNAYLNKEKQQAWFFLLRWLQWISQLGARLYLGDSIFSVFRKTSFLPFQGDWRYTYSFLKYPMWFKLRNFKKWEGE